MSVKTVFLATTEMGMLVTGRNLRPLHQEKSLRITEIVTITVIVITTIIMVSKASLFYVFIFYEYHCY